MAKSFIQTIGLMNIALSVLVIYWFARTTHDTFWVGLNLLLIFASFSLFYKGIRMGLNHAYEIMGLGIAMLLLASSILLPLPDLIGRLGQIFLGILIIWEVLTFIQNLKTEQKEVLYEPKTIKVVN